MEHVTGFDSSQAYEQVTLLPLATIKEGYDGWGNPFRYVMPKHYRFALLDNEGAAEVIIRRYRRLTEENLQAHAMELSTFGVTHLQPSTNGSGYVAISIRDDVDGTLVPRPWGGFTTMEIVVSDSPLKDKLFKRLSIDMIESYYSGEYTFGDGGEFTIKVIEEESVREDGEVYISSKLRDRIVGDTYERIAPEDQLKAENLREKGLKTWTWNTFRAVVDFGLIKGDAVVAQPNVELEADIVVYIPNLKSEVRFPQSGKGIIMMAPKKQGKRIRTNRQILSIVGEWAYGRDLYRVKQEFAAQMESLAKELEDGSYLPAYRESEQEDAVKGINDRAYVWSNLMPLNLSRYLTSMVGEGIAKKLTPTDPKDGDKKRRFPIPNGAAYSIRSTQTYKICRGKDAPVDPHGVFIDPDYGLIVGDAIIEQFLFIAGGGDLDDTIDIIVGFASEDDKFFGIRKGEMVAVCIRNPMSVVSGKHNGEDVIAVEMQIRPISGHGIDSRSRTFNGRQVTEVDVANRPISTAEVETPTAKLTPTPQDFPTEYTKAFAWNRIKDAVEDPYGRYVNLMMAFAHLNIPFPFLADGEVVVDICQQTKNPKDIAQVEQVCETLQQFLVDAIIECGEAVDVNILRRTGILKELNDSGLDELVDVESGMFVRAIEFHTNKVDAFTKSVRATSDHIKSRVADIAPEPSYFKDGTSVGEWLHIRLNQQRRALESRTGEKLSGMNLSEKQRTFLGNHLYSYLMGMVEAGRLSHEELLGYIRELFFWFHTCSVDVNQKFPERVLYYGEMFLLLVEALEPLHYKG